MNERCFACSKLHRVLGSAIQIAAACLVAFLSMAIHMKTNPYVERLSNKAQTVSTSSITSTLICALLLKIYECGSSNSATNYVAQIVFVYVMVFANILTIGTLARLLYNLLAWNSMSDPNEKSELWHVAKLSPYTIEIHWP